MFDAKTLREISESVVHEPSDKIIHLADRIVCPAHDRALKGNVSYTATIASDKGTEGELICYLESLGYKVRTWGHVQLSGDTVYQIHINWGRNG
ncbi:hypothetical protein [Stenotrophomonas phage YB07]|uniref:Uncharacterized protein n=1 Tax=Stenotrophomonas phage YB07 TaxID=2555548 RepID=A0A482IEQ1_9CAUD|nr:hypothetical protein HWC11_gp181 [Stenotrophomonas phage YB07]QBP06377.1 hypothetical protein [Stenotrophomonas phage YB07]